MSFLLPLALVLAGPFPQHETAGWQSAPRLGHLTPHAYQVTRGDALALTFRNASGDVHEWPAVEHLFVRVSGTQTNLDRAPSADGRSFHQLMDTAGVAMIGMDLAPERLRIAPGERDRLADLVPADRLADFLGYFERDHELRLQHHRSSTALVVVSDRSGPFLHSGTAQSKAGQRAEIRLFADPTMLPAGSDLPVRAYVHGAGLGHAVVTATHHAGGLAAAAASGGTVTRTRVITDGSGIGRLDLDRAGLWHLEIHDIRLPDPSPGGDIDGELYSAALTFVVPGEEDDR